MRVRPKARSKRLPMVRGRQPARALTFTTTSSLLTWQCDLHLLSPGTSLLDVVGQSEERPGATHPFLVFGGHEGGIGPGLRVLVSRGPGDRRHESDPAVAEAQEVGGEHDVGHVLVAVEVVDAAAHVEEGRRVKQRLLHVLVRGEVEGGEEGLGDPGPAPRRLPVPAREPRRQRLYRGRRGRRAAREDPPT